MSSYRYALEEAYDDAIEDGDYEDAQEIWNAMRMADLYPEDAKYIARNELDYMNMLEEDEIEEEEEEYY